MKSIALIALGGALGSVLRYYVTLLTPLVLGRSQILTGTLIVNIAGCFLIGFFMQYLEAKQLMDSGLRLLLLVGFLGGFTTFSTFGLEGFELMRESLGQALAYTGLQLFFGIAGVWAGIHLGRWVLT